MGTAEVGALAWSETEFVCGCGCGGGNEEHGGEGEGKDLVGDVGSCPAALLTFLQPSSLPLSLFPSHLISLSSSTACLPSLPPLTLSNQLLTPGSRALVKGPQKGETDYAGVLS